MVYGFGCDINKIGQTLTLNSLSPVAHCDICPCNRRNFRSKLSTCNVVLCGFQTRFKPCLTLVVYGFGCDINKIEQTLTSNSLSPVVHRGICPCNRRNFSSKLSTCNVMLCGFQTRFESCLTLGMYGFGCDIN